MPFTIGQIYNCTEDGRPRQAIVLQTRNGGQEGLLRFIDTRIEEWFRWPAFDQAGKWHRNGSER